MKRLIEKWKNFKYKKDVGYSALALFFGLSAVLGQVGAEHADTPFWWTFWDILTALGIIGFVVGFLYLLGRDRSQD